MNWKRLYHGARLYLIPSGVGRTRYVKKKCLFGGVGDHVMLQPRKLPLYSELIFIGNNVRIASGVNFITHDVLHNVLNHLPEEMRGETVFREKKGKIVIGDNVFIGANSLIMYNVTIGSNVVIGAGSVVTKDLPDNSVCAGVPCRKIGSFDALVEKRRLESAR